MYAVAVQNVADEVKIWVGSAVEFDPKNGGYITLRVPGSASVGFPVGTVKYTTKIDDEPDPPMPEEEKLQAVRDWLDNRMAERHGALALSDDHDMLESLRDVKGLIK